MAGDGDLDVGAWLESLGLGEYAAAFEQNHVDAETLPQLTADDLRELGVGSIGHRRKLLAAIASLAAGQPTTPPDPPVAPPAPAPKPAITVQRRQVTSLFSDLVGYTAMSNRLDAEVIEDLMRQYAQVCTQVIARHDGHIVKFLGDGVLVTFGYPRAHDDDAVRAVRAGLELVAEVGRIAVAGGGFLSARVGLASGEVIAGASAVERDSLVGESTNLASRLQGEAEPGQVVVAPATAALIGGHFVCEKLEPRKLKGFDAPVVPTLVHSEVNTESRFEAARRQGRLPLAGRKSEMARLIDRDALARSGRGQIVVIEGEAGIGKSRLIDEISRHGDLATRERILLQTSPHNAGTPFYAVIKLFEYSARLTAADSPAQRFEKVSAALRRLTEPSEEWLALAATLLGIEAGQGRLLAGFAARDIRMRTMRMLFELLLALARRGAAIVVEDLQWADPSTRELLGMFLPRVRGLPALVLITQRPPPANEARPAWHGEAHVTRLLLEKLAPDEMGILVQGVAADQPLSPATVEAIIARSDGVPIFGEELAYAMVAARKAMPAESQQKGDDATGIPSTLTESLLARLDRPVHGRETAQLAAVIGREVPMKLLIGVSPLKEAAVRSAVDELIDVGILVRHESVAGEAVAFRQSLVRDSAYSLVLRRDRMRLHKRIAEAAEQYFPETLERRLDFVPRHLEAAGDLPAAIAAWRKAGQGAAGQSAVVEAVAHFTRSLNLCLSQPADEARDQQELAILTELAFPTLAMEGWNSARAAEYVGRAITLAARPGANHRIVPVLMAKWLTGMGTGERGSLRGLAEQIESIAQGGSDIDRLMAFRVLSSQFLFEGELHDAVRQFHAFKALYDPDLHEKELGSGATNHAITIDVGLASCLALRGEFDDMRNIASGAIEAAHAGGHLNTICQSIVAGAAFGALLQRDGAALSRYGRELAELAEHHDLPFWLPHAELFGGIAGVLMGQTEIGLARARSAIDAMISGRAFVLSAWTAFYAGACEQVGDIAEIARVLEAAKATIDGGERWFQAEHMRLTALVKRTGGASEASRLLLEEALFIAQRQGAAVFVKRISADLAG